MAKEEEEQPKGKPSLGSFLHNPRYRAKRKRDLLAYIHRYRKEKEKIEGNDGSLKKEMVIGWFSFKWGISGRVVGNYLDELLSIGAVEQRGDRIRARDLAETLLTEIPKTDSFEASV